VLRFGPIFTDYIEEDRRMPKHKSAKKRVKTNLVRQARTRAAKSALKSTLKTLNEMPQEQQEEKVRRIQSVLDKAANGGVLHRNKAARLKSRSRRKAQS
jgi:small subunit ribosomal protein S20